MPRDPRPNTVVEPNSGTAAHHCMLKTVLAVKCISSHAQTDETDVATLAERHPAKGSFVGL